MHDFVWLFVSSKERNKSHILVTVPTSQVTLESPITSLSLTFLIYKIMIIGSPRVVGRIRKIRYVRSVAQRLWYMISKCKPPLPFSTPSNDVFRNASQSPQWNQQVDDDAIQTINPTASKSKIKMVVFGVKTILGDSHYSSPPSLPTPRQMIQTSRVTDSRNNCTWCLQGVKLSSQSYDLESTLF